MAKLRTPLICALAVLALGFASGWLSGSAASDPWFQALNKPAFMPPGWAFPVAWTILYLLIGWAAGLILQSRRPQKTPALGVFAAQLALNLIWSPLFFRFHQTGAALGVIVAMLALTALTLILFARIRPRAAALLAPYLAWLAFATALNAAIVVLN